MKDNAVENFVGILKLLGLLAAAIVGVILYYYLFLRPRLGPEERIVVKPAVCKPGQEVVLQFPFFPNARDGEPKTKEILVGRHGGSLCNDLKEIPMSKNVKDKVWEATVACPDNPGEYCTSTFGPGGGTYTGHFASTGR